MSGVRRARKPRAPRKTPPRGVYAAALSAEANESDLGAAAELIAKEARRLAGEWSATIPEQIQVTVDGDTAIVSCAAGPAYPNEVDRVRHPVYGPTLKNPRPAWVANKHRPFLGPAAELKAGDAMQRYAQRIDQLAKEAGFR